MSLRVALIGCGLIGQKRLNLLPPGSVTVACDTQLERAEKLAAQCPGCIATDSFEEAFRSPNVDAAIIATANNALAPIAQWAVREGKHVLVEKPGAISTKAQSNTRNTPAIGFLSCAACVPLCKAGGLSENWAHSRECARDHYDRRVMADAEPCRALP